MEFFVAPMDTPGILQELTEHAPENPFCTPAYFQAMRCLRTEPWIVGLRDGARLYSGAGMFITRGRLNRLLEIVSLPAAAAFEEFWRGLFHFAAKQGISRLEANSFASSAAIIPVFQQEIERRARCEYIIDLKEFHPSSMSVNHRRNLRKAGSQGFAVRRSVELDTCREHSQLMGLSQERRRKRGEVIAAKSSVATLMPFLEWGCGELFQAAKENQVFSSILVLRAPKGAYYQSAGTSLEGMSLGASHFLISSLACQLREEGLRVLNLGGAPTESTLARFKIGFGSKTVPLTAVTLEVGLSWRRGLTAAVELVRKCMLKSGGKL